MQAVFKRCMKIASFKIKLGRRAAVGRAALPRFQRLRVRWAGRGLPPARQGSADSCSVSCLAAWPSPAMTSALEELQKDLEDVKVLLEKSTRKRACKQKKPRLRPTSRTRCSRSHRRKQNLWTVTSQLLPSQQDAQWRSATTDEISRISLWKSTLH